MKFLFLALFPSFVLASEPILVPELNVEGSRLTNERRSVHVIGTEEIARSNALHLGDLLRRSSGVEFSANFTGAASASLRGGNGAHTLVYVDGVKVNDPTDPTRAFDFSSIDLALVERVEIYKGAQSVSFGSDALSGVILITTKRPAVARTDLTAVGSVNGDRLKGNAAISRTFGERLSLGMQLAHERSEGVSAARVSGGDDDSSKLTSIGAKIESALTAKTRLEIGWIAKFLKQELDAGANQDDPNSLSRSLTHELHAKLTTPLTERVETRVLLTRKTVRRAYDDPADPANTSAFDAIYRGSNHGLDLQNRLFLSDAHELVIGGEWAQEYMKIDSFGTPTRLKNTKTEIWSGFIQDRIELLRGLTVDVGTRYDNPSSTSTSWNGKAGIELLVGETLKTTAAFGTGFKAPSLYSLYDPTYGNDQLLPERSRSFEIGAEFAPSDALVVKSTAFLTRYRDLISYDSVTYRSINIGQAEVRGVEFENRFLKNGPLSFALHATYLNSRNRNTQKELPKRAKWKGGLVADWNLSARLHAQAEFLAKTSRLDSASGTARVPGYGFWNLSADYGLRENLKLLARLENAFDQDTTETLGYTPLGRTFSLGARASF